MTVANLDERRTFQIGGSDAAAACGVNPYQSRVSLWLEKTGRIERETNEAMAWGNLLEPVIMAELEAQGYEVMPAPADGFQDGWRVGHPDGFTPIDGRMGLVSVKTAGQWAGQAWNDGAVPLAYQVQEQHYLSLWPDAEAVLFACLIAGQRLETRIMRRDEKAIARIVELEAEFYDYLKTDTPPPPSVNGDALLLHPTAEQEVTRLLGDGWDAYRKAKVSAEQLAVVKDQHERNLERLKAHVGDAATALSPWDEVVARWTSYDRTSIDTKALRVARPDVAQEFSTTKPQRRFTLE